MSGCLVDSKKDVTSLYTSPRHNTEQVRMVCIILTSPSFIKHLQYICVTLRISLCLLYPIVRDKPPTWAWTCTDFSRSSRSSYILASTTILPCPRTFSRCLKIQWRKQNQPKHPLKHTNTIKHPPSAFYGWSLNDASVLTTHPRRRIENCSNTPLPKARAWQVSYSFRHRPGEIPPTQLAIRSRWKTENDLQRRMQAVYHLKNHNFSRMPAKKHNFNRRTCHDLSHF